MTVERIPPWTVLGAIMLVGWGVAVAAGRIAGHDGWLYYHGGDGTWYYTTSWVLGNGHIPTRRHRLRLSAPDRPDRRDRRLEPARRHPRRSSSSTSSSSRRSRLACIYGITRMFASRLYAYVVSLAVGARPGRRDPLLPRRLPQPLRRPDAALGDRADGARRLPVDGRAARGGLLPAARRRDAADSRRSRGRARRRVRARGQARERAVPARRPRRAGRRPAAARARRSSPQPGPVADRSRDVEVPRARLPARVLAPVRRAPATVAPLLPAASTCTAT